MKGRWSLLVSGAYLLGSVSFGYVIVRRLTGKDLRTLGSGNPGATNVLRTVGPEAAGATLALDLAKGAAPVSMARALGAPPDVARAAAVAAVLGHVFPAFHDLRGGKGVATAAGALAALDPIPTLLAAGLFFAVVGRGRYVSAGSIAATSSLPLFSHLFRDREHGGAGWAALVIPALVLFRHAANLDRLRQGTEPRLGGS